MTDKKDTFLDKLRNLITTHNSDSTSHSDIRTTLEGKANSSSVPTKTSDLTNDSGFLTSHQDISGKANVADLVSKADSSDFTTVDVVVTYTDGTTETISLYCVPASQNDDEDEAPL